MRPKPYRNGRKSTARSRFRVIDALQRTGVPSSFSTAMPSARLPGVCPFQTTSNQAGASHSTTNMTSSARPQPALPK